MDESIPLLVIPSGGAGRRQILRDCARAGIAKKTPAGIAGWQSLRKAYATLIAPFVGDAKTYQSLTRHSSLELTLQVYAATDDERRRQAVLDAAEKFYQDFADTNADTLKKKASQKACEAKIQRSG
jgi:integrase